MDTKTVWLIVGIAYFLGVGSYVAGFVARNVAKKMIGFRPKFRIAHNAALAGYLPAGIIIILCNQLFPPQSGVPVTILLILYAALVVLVPAGAFSMLIKDLEGNNLGYGKGLILALFTGIISGLILLFPLFFITVS